MIIEIKIWQWKALKILSIVFFLISMFLLVLMHEAKHKVLRTSMVNEYLENQVNELEHKVKRLESSRIILEKLAVKQIETTIKKNNEIINRPYIDLSDSSAAYIEGVFKKKY